jgi:hypothetical protein
MFRRLVPLLAFALIAGLPAASAMATTPVCTAHMSTLRYRPEYTASCPGQTITAVELIKTSNDTPIGIARTALQTSDVTVDVNGTLASNVQYRLRLTVSDGVTADGTFAPTFRTLKAPANPNLHVKYITAIPPDAVLDMAHRIDRANIVAVPVSGDFIDASTRSLSAAAYTAALKHHQSALVVTGEKVLNTAGLGSALTTYCNAKHGVVVAGQTHWLAGGAGWSEESAIGRQGASWEKHWSLYSYEDVTVERATGGGDLAPGSVQSHFLTKGLTSFHVVGPGSGAVQLRDYAQGHMLAKLRAPGVGFFNTYHGEFLISEHQIESGRVVDLGFRPWSSAVSNGGFDPAQSPGGPLTARALWWATNRIPPTNTHFTSVPPRTSTKATVIVGMAAKDADKENPFDIGYRYKVDGGSWKKAVGATFVLYHLAKGRHHTVYARAYDDGGNVDPHAARYTFYVTPGALG